LKKALIFTGIAIILAACGTGGKKDGNEASPSQPAASSPGATNSAAPTAGGAGTPFKIEQVASSLVEGRFGDVYARTSEEFRAQIGEADFKAAYEGFAGGTKQWAENSEFDLNGMSYRSWTNPEKDKGLIATFDGKAIKGLMMKPLESFPASDEDLTKLAYGNPFEGEWYVIWGGRDVMSNYHYEYESQRYAYDLLQVRDGFSYKGDATRNESYYAFGQPVFASQDGKVVHVTDGIKDNVPVGAMNPEHPAGNAVVIDHGNGEFSYLAHLKEGSVKVKVGDKVSRGDEIGLCGNSGNSSEPHLHYQVSDGPDLYENKSIRVRWEDGADPIQGMTIQSK